MASSARLGFERQVRDALAHLHDAAYIQSHPLTRFLRAEGSARPTSLGRALRQALLDAVESLKPTAEVPASTHAFRTYQILRLRFVDALEVPQVLDRLSLSKSLYYLELQRAIDGVSAVLWESWGLGERGESSDRSETNEIGEKSEGTEPESRQGKEGTVGTAQDRQAARSDATRESSGKPPTNLPAQLTSFVGREREIAEAELLLTQSRLLTLTGAGGSGKTRLALHVAACLEATYPDGVWLVDLGALADPALVPQAVCAVLGLAEEPGRPILSRLIDYLRAKRLLLVLDNCEHLVEACANLVDALLRACPTLAVLATSREALRTDGETVYLVPPLAVPDPEHLPALAELLGYGGVQLFAERAASVSQGFQVDARNASSVARICSRLDGLPLAIELSAARVRMLTTDQIARRLDDRFGLLTGGSRTALPRHQTLEATLAWSYEQLLEPERALFRRLAVFAGGWTLEAAEAVCSGSGLEPGDVFGLLTRLVEKSLVVAVPGERETRYRLLETIREYANNWLMEAGEADYVRGEHLGWYLALAERGSPELFGREQSLWMDRFDAELGNLRTAQDWSRAQGSVELELRLVTAVAYFCLFGGFDREARDRLASVLTRSTGMLSDTRAAALILFGGTESVLGHPSRAIELYTESLVLAREAGDRVLEARALMRLGWVAGDLGQLSDSRGYLEEALSIARQAGLRREPVDILVDLGGILTREGHHNSARLLKEESLVIARELDDRLAVGDALIEMGQDAAYQGDYPRAREELEQGLAIARELRVNRVIDRGLCYLGDLARAEGDSQTAESRYRDFLTSAVGSGIRTHLAMALGRLADLRVVQGRSEWAARLYGALDAWYAGAGMPVPYKPHRDHERDVARARTALGEETFTRAWAAGEAMTLEQAVEYALHFS